MYIKLFIKAYTRLLMLFLKCKMRMIPKSPL